ncbi:MAG TPA: hypothetical protein VFD69_18230 [Vicinamibacterales bacterium]|nr:hypothetical protein [Vicinamibacterales bacterium]
MVEDQKLLGANLTLAFRAERHQAGQARPALQRKDEETLFFEIPAQTGFTVGDIDAFNDLAAWRPEPTPEFHDDSFAQKQDTTS